MYPILLRSLVVTVLALICGANITMWIPNSQLSASCADDKGVLISTSIDLNDCIGFDRSRRSLICGYFTLHAVIKRRLTSILDTATLRHVGIEHSIPIHILFAAYAAMGSPTQVLTVWTSISLCTIVVPQCTHSWSDGCIADNYGAYGRSLTEPNSGKCP